jgi:N-methylhydantoinase B
LRKNVRMADQVEGDLEAQLGALAIMERRIDELIATYGLTDLSELSSAVRERTEAAVRQAITALPDGHYAARVETDGLTDTPVEIKVAVEIAGDEVRIDFAGSSEQVAKAVNCPLCYTRAMSSYAIKAALAPELPNNDGALRAITLIAPEGSIVNPLHPASVGSRVLTGHYIPALVMDALAGIAPDKVLAGAGSPIWCVNINGSRPDGSPVAGLFFYNGGMGASASGDGLSCVSWPSNISTTPAEEIEHRLPIRVIRRSLREGSGGAGQFTGGSGQEVELEYTGSKPGAVAFLAERIKAPANGIAGGGQGAPGRLEIDGKPADPKAQHLVQPGSRIVLATPGGGGYGPA